MTANPRDSWTYDALTRGDIAAVQKRVIDDPDYIESRDYLGRTPLMVAICYGNLELVGFLLERGADPNVTDDEGYTYLLAAVESDCPSSFEIVAALIAGGADIHKAGVNGWTPLHMAAVRGLVEKARLLVDMGAGVDERKKTDGFETPLMEAAEHGHTEMVRLLLEAGADPTLRDTVQGETPLEIARRAAKGADPDVYRIAKELGPALDPLRVHTELVAGLQLPQAFLDRLESELGNVDMAEMYRENADRLAREGDHEGVIRVLTEWEARRSRPQ